MTNGTNLGAGAKPVAASAGTPPPQTPPAPESTDQALRPPPAKPAPDLEKEAVQQELQNKAAESGSEEKNVEDGKEVAKEEEKVVPEKYDIAPPEKTLLDSSDVERIAAYARERGLSNDQAQEVLEREHDAMATYHNKQIAAFLERTESWKQEVAGDKEIGGANLQKSLGLVQRLLAQHDPDGSFKRDLEATRYGNHPGLIKFLYRIAKETIAEDETVRAHAPSGSRKSTEDLLYGETKEPNQ